MNNLKLMKCTTCQESNIVNNPKQVELVPRMVKLLEEVLATSEDPKLFLQAEVILQESKEAGSQ